MGKIQMWKGFRFKIDSDKNLNMTYPDFYEGIEGYGDKKITTSAMKTIIADWIDAPNRRIPLSKIEKQWVKKFTPKEQVDIFGKVLVSKSKLKKVA